jgi:uncharacterized protein
MIPFSFGNTELGTLFVNREEDVARLETNLINKINTILISPRRWGKSALVSKVANKLAKDDRFSVCRADLYDVRTEEEFFATYSRAILKGTNSNTEDMIRNGSEWLRSLVPKLSYSIDDFNEVSFGFDFSGTKPDLRQLLDEPERIGSRKGKHILVLLDEFQNIGHFKDPVGFQKILRAHWQTHKNVTYCLYGSRRNMLIDFFGNVKMPFYRFGDIMNVDKIKPEKWHPFILKGMREGGKEIEPEVIDKLLELVDNIPFYVQQLAYLLFVESGENVSMGDLENAFKRIMDQYRAIIYQMLEDLPSSQINLLKAIVAGITKFGTKEIIDSYKLGSAALAAKSLKALDKNEIIDTADRQITIIDPFVKYIINPELKRKAFQVVK